MREIISSGQKFRRRVFPSRDAAKTELAGEPYKLELVDLKGQLDTGEVMEVGGGELTIYDHKVIRAGQFYRGHMQHVEEVELTLPGQPPEGHIAWYASSFEGRGSR